MTNDEKYNRTAETARHGVSNIAVAFVVVGLVTPVVSGDVPGTPAGGVTLAWCVAGIFLETPGRHVLGDLR